MKQALRSAIKSYAIPEEECRVAMTTGVIDMLTVIDTAKLIRGIRWARREIESHCLSEGIVYSSRKWSWFWMYFDRTWVKQYTIDVWNGFGMENILISCATPFDATVVTIIKTLSGEYVRQVADIPRGRARRTIIQLPAPVELPFDLDESGYDTGDESNDALDISPSEVYD
ncbi:LOW QUALITY PROTEIN: hypothetical protein PHMEG_00027873 [Phytophthora megakarya]|uniref:Uncharacterized protein n=1 Tax=Phytophthora megakarya TaxID=4795 RepID=A0A225V7G3_9STRA|nr:LOW QUALITY PROTEIN: hypothetical protein PHMEG_00027873 [Phytophthora megakarya]